MLTDKRSVPYLDKLFRKFIHRDLISKGKHIQVTYDFVDTTVITQKYRRAINEMRPYFTSNTKAAKKYTDDLFLMGPYYHRVFPYEKFIVLDADLKFRIDISELYSLFDEFDTHQVYLCPSSRDVPFLNIILTLSRLWEWVMIWLHIIE